MPLHPIVQQHIKLWYRNKLDLMWDQPVEQLRKIFLTPLAVDPSLPLNYTDYLVDGNFYIRLFRPSTWKENYPLPIIVFLRASGFAFGNIHNFNLPGSYLAETVHCLVAGIEHRLSPEFKYPIPLNDCESAIAWLTKHGEQLSIDTSRMILWGECSGGNLSTALCHRLVEKQRMPFLHHIVFYPPLNFSEQTASKCRFGKGYMVDTNVLKRITEFYTNTAEELYSPEVSPALYQNCNNMPATSICIGEYDIFLDEVRAYHKKLLNDGISSRLQVVPGLVHGFTQYYNKIPEVLGVLQEYGDFIRKIT